jgi:hypothetical protein
MAAKHSPSWLRTLKVQEASLVDKPANPGAWIALAKADKPLGVDELALPIYEPNRDPKWKKQKRSKMKYSDVKDMVAKGEALRSLNWRFGPCCSAKPSVTRGDKEGSPAKPAWASCWIRTIARAVT